MNLATLLSLKTWFSVGARRRPEGIYEWIFTPFAVAVGVYVIVAATIVIIAPWTLTVLFFSGVGALAFLTTGAFEDSNIDRPSIIDAALALASIAVGVYFAIQAPTIINRIALLDELTQLDVIFGTLVFIITLEITRRTTGLGLTALVVIFAVYNLFG
ncbi:MAG: hypothetical protein QF605_00180, partial [Rhodospirillales bacterium]|nr:hypothetical protein [Rhodospirillales bacterium]